MSPYSDLKKELDRMGISYSVKYIEDNPDLQKKYKLMGSPNIVVDGELVFRGMPSISNLEAYFKKKGAGDALISRTGIA